MPQVDREQDLQLLLDHARAAGEIARRHHGTDVETWEKDEGAGPVTEADMEIDAMLRERLTAARPNYGWLSEETEDDSERCSRDVTFIVDPIDGTRAFMRAGDDFCHALAIAERGEVVAAAVLKATKREPSCRRELGCHRARSALEQHRLSQIKAATRLVAGRSLSTQGRVGL